MILRDDIIRWLIDRMNRCQLEEYGEHMADSSSTIIIIMALWCPLDCFSASGHYIILSVCTMRMHFTQTSGSTFSHIDTLYRESRRHFPFRDHTSNTFLQTFVGQVTWDMLRAPWLTVSLNMLEYIMKLIPDACVLFWIHDDPSVLVLNWSDPQHLSQWQLYLSYHLASVLFVWRWPSHSVCNSASGVPLSASGAPLFVCQLSIWYFGSFVC